MTKKCKVIARNDINMVVVYDGIEIQMPTDGTCNNDIYIEKVENNFIVSSDDKFKKINTRKQKKTSEAELANATETATDEIIELK